MATFSQNYSDSSNGWDVTIFWECDFQSTSAYMWWEVNRNAYGRTFQLYEKGSGNRYDSGSNITIGNEYYLYVYRNGSYSQQKGPFTAYRPDPPVYTISYNANGGTGAPGSQTKNYNVNLTLSSAVPTRTGYDFLGWGNNSTSYVSFQPGGTYTANASATLYAVWRVKTFTLSLSQGAGTSLTVKRTSSPLGQQPIGTVSNGGTICYNDVLTVTASANTGYTSLVIKAGGTNITSNPSVTVTSDVTISTTASVMSFTLTLLKDVGSRITVTRTQSPKAGASTGVLQSDATIYHSDVLNVVFSAVTGYSLVNTKVNGASFTSGNNHTVTSATTIQVTSIVLSYKLTLDAGVGSIISVVRTSSPLKGAETGKLLSNADIYYSDVLTITFSAETGYNFSSGLVNSNSFTSGNNLTVTSAVYVKTTATVKSFTLTLTPDVGSSITVKRTKSPLASATIGSVSNNGAIYYRDELEISFSAKTGYDLITHTVNGKEFTSGSSHVVTSAVIAISTSLTQEFTLTLSLATGSQVVVERINSPKKGAQLGVLSNEAKVYNGDELKITANPLTGYNLTSTKVNNKDFVSGSIYTVVSNVLVALLAEVKSFLLKMSPHKGTTITVNRTSSPKKDAPLGPVADSEPVYYSDVLQISCSALEGYTVSGLKVNNVNHVSGESKTVTDNVSVVSEAIVKFFTLTLSPGVGTSISIRRTASPKQGATLGILSNGATIYYSDVLTVSYDVETGYMISTHTINGTIFTSGEEHTVTTHVKVITTSSVRSFSLSISKDQGSSVRVYRTSSPKKGAASGELSDGSTIYYSDVLQITISTLTGWEFVTHTVNSQEWISGNKVVTGNVTIIVVTKQMGLVYIDTGSSLEKYQVYIYNGSEWELYIPYLLSSIDSGVPKWDLCS